MDSRSFIETKIAQKPIFLIGKAYDPLTREVVLHLKRLNLNNGRNDYFEALLIDGRQDVSVIDTYIYQKWLTRYRTVCKQSNTPFRSYLISRIGPPSWFELIVLFLFHVTSLRLRSLSFNQIF